MNNQLIRGRLILTQADIQKLYRKKIKQNQQIQKELSKEKNVVKFSLEQIKNLKTELKYYEETFQKAFYPSNENISLLYKKIGHHYYIKARFYWNGQQREVQLGSIPIVLNIIKKMLDRGYLKDISIPKSDQMTWGQFKKRSYLLDATRQIAALKFQEYIIRKLLLMDIDQSETGALDKINIVKPSKKNKVKNNDGDYSDEVKLKWYLQWKKNNL